MSQLSSADLSYMRETLSDLMPGTCHILSLTQTSDGQGGFTETWGTAVSSVACRFDSANGSQYGRELIAGGALQPFNAYVVTMPYDTAVTAANRIEFSGNQYSVIGVDSDKSWEASTRCGVEKV